MTQKEYIKKLRFYLALRLPHAELSDIISDMEELFSGAAADGKSEAQICLAAHTSDGSSLHCSPRSPCMRFGQGPAAL